MTEPAYAKNELSFVPPNLLVPFVAPIMGRYLPGKRENWGPSKVFFAAHGTEVAGGKPLTTERFKRDAEWIEKARNGHEQSFAQLVEHYWPMVRHFLNKSVNDRELAADLAQETFLRVYQSLHQFDLTRNFSPWLFRIAVNQVKDHRRKKTNRWVMVVPDDLELSCQKPSPENQACGKLMLEEVFQDLALEMKILLILKHGLDFSYEELAEVCDEPVGTIKVQLFRLRKKLQEAWAVPEAEPELVTEKEEKICTTR